MKWISFMFVLDFIPPTHTPSFNPSGSPQSAELSSLCCTVDILPPSPHIHTLCLDLYSCPENRFICTIFLDSTYMRYHMIFVFHFLTSVSMTNPTSIHISTNDPVSLLFMTQKYSIICMHHIFFIHSSINGHLGWFHVLATVNSAAMNIGLHVSFWIMVFSGYIPSSGIAGS